MSHDLAALSDHLFEQRCGVLLQAVFPDLRSTSPRSKRDRAGMDHCIFVENPGGLTSVFQCKGFEVTEMRHQQVADCLKSIVSFSRSSFNAKKYFLVVNRVMKDDVRDTIEESLTELTKSGKAEEVGLLNNQDFVQMLFEEARRQVKRLIDETVVRLLFAFLAPGSRLLSLSFPSLLP